MNICTHDYCCELIPGAWEIELSLIKLKRGIIGLQPVEYSIGHYKFLSMVLEGTDYS